MGKKKFKGFWEEFFGPVLIATTSQQYKDSPGSKNGSECCKPLVCNRTSSRPTHRVFHFLGKIAQFSVHPPLVAAPIAVEERACVAVNLADLCSRFNT